MKLLFLTTVNPVNRSTGGEVASDNIITAFKMCGHDVTTVFYSRVGGANQYHDDVCVSERQIESSESLLKPMYWLLRSLILNIPYSVSKFRSKAYLQQVNNYIAYGDYDVVVIDHAQMGWLLKYIPSHIRVIFIAHNVEKNIYLELSETAGLTQSFLYKREGNLISRIEASLAKRAYKTMVLTLDDGDFFYVYTKHVLPLSMPFSLHKPKKTSLSQKPNLLRIIGTWSWDSNKKGLLWFLEQVLPFIHPKVTIEVAGKGADEIFDTEYSNVSYKGFVKSSSDFLSEATVVAIPSVAGSGIQIKTLEAMTVSSSIVATGVALRGIDDIEENILIENEPVKFAGKINQLIEAGRAPTLHASHERVERFLHQIKSALIHHNE